MNAQIFFKTLAEVYARQANVKVARVNIIEKKNPATKEETDNLKSRYKSA